MAAINVAAFCLALTLISSDRVDADDLANQQKTPRIAPFEDNNSYRLNTTILPLTYDIRLVLFLDNSTFSGNVSITIETVEAVDQLVLHMFRLDFDFKSVTIKELSCPHDEVVVKDVIDDGYYEKDFYRFDLESSLKAKTRYVITFPKYTSRLNKDCEGFYKGHYFVNDTQRWFATTHFEPTNARQVFPCFDEPRFKARFTISISRPEGLRAISNMPQAGQPQLDTEHTDVVRYWDHFEETPLMSTYLVAFFISDFEYLDEKMRIFAEPQLVEYTRYALSHSKGILDWLADYVGVSYDMPKMDQVAIEDFKEGAMENWGLVIYQQNNLLIDDASSPAADKQFTAMIIAHEFAHQWFGDLVSPQWWKYLWLNEGFATYFQYFTVAKIHPEWRLEEQFAVSAVHKAMLFESDISVVRPMTANVSIPPDIRSMFDPISYEKAGSVIRMIESVATTQTFRKAIGQYVKSKSYSSATDEDLFDCFAEEIQSDKVVDDTIDIKEVMRSWAQQAGFLVLTVTREYANESATLTQKRSPLHSKSADEVDNKWYIPLTYTNEALADFSTRPKHWMRPVDKTIHVANLGNSSQWVLFNINCTGYYRVNYDERNWQLLSSHLKSSAYSTIPPVNRAQLVHDAFNLARAQLLPYHVALNLSVYLRQEVDYIPWYAADRALEVILWKFGMNPPDEAKGVFEKFLNYLHNKRNAMFGVEACANDEHISRLSRAAAAKLACQTAEKECVVVAIRSVDQWMINPTRNQIDPDLREAFYCAAVRHGNSTVFDFFTEQQRLISILPSERDLIIKARGCSEDQEMLRSFLDEAVDRSPDSKQNPISVFNSVNAHPLGMTVTFGYITKHFKQVEKAFGSLNEVIKMIDDMASRSDDLEHAFRLTQMLTTQSNTLGPYATVIRDAIETIEKNNEWYESTGKTIIRWIKEFFETLQKTSSDCFEKDESPKENN